MEKFIFYLITQKVAQGNRPGFLGWLARQFNHPYGWISAISEDDFSALQKLDDYWFNKKPVICEICGKEATRAIIQVTNPTDEPQDLRDLFQDVHQLCDDCELK